MSDSKGYVYFARPIDFVTDSVMTGEYIRFQNTVEQVLAESGYSVYHPAYAWNVNGPMTSALARAIESTNRFALRRAEAVVAWLPKGIPTQGVPMEIEFASRELGIPVIVFGQTGASIMGNSLVTCLPDSELEHLGMHLDVSVPNLQARNNPTIQYSAPEGVTLHHAHPGDAGVDLRASEDVLIHSGTQAFVPSGVRISIPSSMFGWIVARSSTFGRHGLMVLPGIIDSEFQGELGISCVNATTQAVQVRKGDRLGQVLLLANMWPGFALQQTDKENVFPHRTSRGPNGFGSSGR